MSDKKKLLTYRLSLIIIRLTEKGNGQIDESVPEESFNFDKGDVAMAEATGDRRARRSRKLLKQGLLELLREKRFFQISVRDITERMDLNRGTFYLHYPDTTALMRSVEEDMISEIQQLVDAHMRETVEQNSLRPVFEPVLDYVVAHRDACKALFDNESSVFLEKLQGLVYGNGAHIIRARYAPRSEEDLTYLLNFTAFGLIGLMKTWFNGGMALPKEDLLRTAELLTAGAAEKLLNTAPVKT